MSPSGPLTRAAFDADFPQIAAQVKRILACKPSAPLRRQTSVLKVFHGETSRPIAEVLRTEFGMVVVTFRSEDTAPLGLEPLTDDPLQVFEVASVGGNRLPRLTAAMLYAHIVDGVTSFHLPSMFPYSNVIEYHEDSSEIAKLYLTIANHAHVADLAEKPEIAAIFDVQPLLRRLNAIRNTPQRPQLD
jgi:hypothetical protein